MHLDLILVLASAVVGLLVGLTGVGGGALMTPMLVLFFGVAPTSAITSDLVAALFMRPAGVLVHWRRGSVNTALVTYLCYGSVPAALAGTYVMHLMGDGAATEHRLAATLGGALVLGALAMGARTWRTPGVVAGPARLRPLTTVALGAVGGFMVGLTSIGAGSLIVMLLAVAYPMLAGNELVGTDLAQSVPLTLAATLGSLLFGHVNVSLTASIVVGSVPTVVVGSLLSSTANTRWLRQVIAGMVLLSGLKYVGVPVQELGAVAAVVVVVVVLLTLGERRRASTVASVPEPVEDVVALLPPGLDAHAQLEVEPLGQLTPRGDADVL